MGLLHLAVLGPPKVFHDVFIAFFRYSSTREYRVSHKKEGRESLCTMREM